MSSSLKPLDQLIFTRFYRESSVEGALTSCSVVLHHWMRWPPCPYMVKKCLKSSCQNHENFKAETWYIALGTQGLPSLFNDDPRMTFALLMAQPNLCLSCRYTMSVLLRWANCGLWVFSLFDIGPFDCSTLSTLLANSAEDRLMIFFLFFLENRIWHFIFKLSPLETFHMKCQNLFSVKNKKNISKCCLLKFLLSILW